MSAPSAPKAGAPQTLRSLLHLDATSGPLIKDEKLHKRIVRAVLTAIVLGICVILLRGLPHPFAWGSFLTSGMTALAAFGAAIGLGGVLGFLFGVPIVPKGPVINNPGSGTVAVTTGPDSKASAEVLRVQDSAASPNAKTASDPTIGASETDGGNSGVQTQDSAHQAQIGTPQQVAGSVKQSDPKVPEGGSKQTSDREEDGKDESATPYVTGFSNLEQVADWVTKLLLGGGLTQMQRIPPKIWQWSRLVALGMLGEQPGQGNESLIVAYQAFAAALLVYGFIVGFFGGYLITKLQLGRAIAQIP